MKNTFKYKGLKLAAISLALVIGGMTLIRTSYVHTHVLKNGRLVIHSHPYQKQNDSAPFKNHQHTPVQLAMIDASSLLFFMAALISFVQSNVTEIIRGKVQLMSAAPKVFLLIGRSPPFHYR